MEVYFVDGRETNGIKHGTRSSMWRLEVASNITDRNGTRPAGIRCLFDLESVPAKKYTFTVSVNTPVGMLLQTIRVPHLPCRSQDSKACRSVKPTGFRRGDPRGRNRSPASASRSIVPAARKPAGEMKNKLNGTEQRVSKTHERCCLEIYNCVGQRNNRKTHNIVHHVVDTNTQGDAHRKP